MVLMIIIMIIIVINNNNEQNMTAAGVSTSSKLRRLTIRCFPWGRGGISSSTKMCCSLPRDVLPHTQAFCPKGLRLRLGRLDPGSQNIISVGHLCRDTHLKSLFPRARTNDYIPKPDSMSALSGQPGEEVKQTTRTTSKRKGELQTTGIRT